MTLNRTISLKLSPELEKFIKLIFDISAMKEVISELFDLDMDEIYLGKLNGLDIEEAYNALTLSLKSPESPHQMGGGRGNTSMPADLQKKELDELDKWESLSGIKTAYSMLQLQHTVSMLKELKAGTSDGSRNPIENLYEKLNTTLTVLLKGSNDFKNIKKYVQNSRYDDNYNIEIQEIFHVKRTEEDERYKLLMPKPKLHLLFHGSRVTNLAGILAHGLMKAPPEVPFTGYRFGKGIYFADMTSKSVNYCNINFSRENNIGILLICEVNLGDIEEITDEVSEPYNLPSFGYNSVKGVGNIHPNFGKAYNRTTHGVEIPMKITIKKDDNRELPKYNEYVIYENERVYIRYLVLMKFSEKD
ncbi:hypothetical protein DMENIID0001_103780 [Sergentomyia squamirostris]